MAIDPATAKVLITLAKQVITDKNMRQILFIIIAIPIILILVIVSSPFAILFSSMCDSTGDTDQSVIDIMTGLQNELQARIQAECFNDDSIAEIKVVYMGGEGEVINNVGDVLALYAVAQNMMEDPEQVQQVFSLTAKQANELETLYWRMNTLSVDLITIEDNHTPDSSSASFPTPVLAPPPINTEVPATPSTPEPRMMKYVYVTCLSYEDVLDGYNFSEQQLTVLREMVTEYNALFSGMGGNTVTLSAERIAEIRAGLPEGLDGLREEIVLAAYSLVDRVDYFWGGHSKTIGWDDQWGKMTLVTSEGSPATGTIRPYGLDCSGYTAWVFVNGYYNTGLSEEESRNLVIHNLGSGTWTQWDHCLPITENEVLPGDLAFRCIPGTGQNHVGVVVGYNADGILIVAHCSSSRGGVVVTPYQLTFHYLRRPIILTEGEEGT